VFSHHLVRLLGAQLGSRADRMPAGARRALSLERRASFVPLESLPQPSGFGIERQSR
jgi:hypothetical protein